MEQKPLFRRRLHSVIVLLVAVVLLAVDQISKYYVLRFLRPVGSISVIDGLLEFSYLENTGAAFGLFHNIPWAIFVFNILVSLVLLIILFRYRNHTFFSLAALALLLSGGIGNLLDRVFHGFVVDFIHVLFFGYVFNFADCCVTVGAVLLSIHVLLAACREKKAGNTPADSQEHPV